MGEVHEHAQAVHFAHDLSAERRQAVVRGLVGGRVRPSGVLGMGKCHVAPAQRVHLAQCRQRVVDLVTALDTDHRGDAAGLVDARHVGGGVGHLKVGGISFGQRLHEVDLLDRDLDGERPLDLHRDEDRPELTADTPFAQPRDVGHQRARAVLQVDRRRLVGEPLAELPRQVVVAVDEGRLGEDLVQARCVGGGVRRGGRCR